MRITISPLVGIVPGVAAGRASLLAQAQDTTPESHEGIAVLVLSAYLLATMSGVNRFISAFACGTGFGQIVGQRCMSILDVMQIVARK